MAGNSTVWRKRNDGSVRIRSAPVLPQGHGCMISQLVLGLGGMWGWVNLDREQLQDIAKLLVPGIGAMVLLLLALS